MSVRLVWTRPVPDLAPVRNEIAKLAMSKHPCAIAARSDNIDRYYGNAFKALLAYVEGRFQPPEPPGAA
jgi:hypothetical protein